MSFFTGIYRKLAHQVIIECFKWISGCMYIQMSVCIHKQFHSSISYRCSLRLFSRRAWLWRRSCAACGAKRSFTGCRPRSSPPWRESGPHWRETGTRYAATWTPCAPPSARLKSTHAHKRTHNAAVTPNIFMTTADVILLEGR